MKYREIEVLVLPVNFFLKCEMQYHKTNVENVQFV